MLPAEVSVPYSSPSLSCLQYKVWLKPSAEQQFLYGNHVQKAGLGRITEGTQQYQGVVFFSMNDLPLVSTSLHNYVGYKLM